jgi:hypothetical protein
MCLIPSRRAKQSSERGSAPQTERVVVEEAFFTGGGKCFDFSAKPHGTHERCPEQCSMKIAKILSLSLSALVLAGTSAMAQYEFKFTFSGSTVANVGGNIVSTPYTEKNIIQETAADGGADPATLDIVYHISGSSFGDTVDIIRISDGAVLRTMYGLFFAEDPSLGRTAITNAAQTEVRRLDYIYTDQNSHSMGSSFTTKRIVTDSGGVTHTTFEGPMQWLELQRPNRPTRIISGSFITGAVVR